MDLTEFGKAIRNARFEAGNVSLASMATALKTTPSFLSRLERGRKKIPAGWVLKLEQYFQLQGVVVSLGELADLANGSVSLDGLPLDQQILMAALARARLDEAELAKLRKLLKVSKRLPK